MRDNHEGMPEIIDTFERDGSYFGIIGVEIDNIYKKFHFGVSYKSYLALKRILQLRPFDQMPGLKYKYFFSGSYYKIEDTSDGGVYIRIEQGRNGKEVDVRVTKDLLANLVWVSEVKSFDELAHLTEVE
jgi:hypothetical protein